MEVVKRSPEVGIEAAEEEEVCVSLQKKRFRPDSNNTIKTYESGLSVQPLPPAQSLNDEEDKNSKNGRVELRKEIENEVGELDLESVYDKPGSHNFYCPNCNSCVTKVIIRAPIVSCADTYMCTSCFGFLVPIGNWFFPKLVPPVEEDHIEQKSNEVISFKDCQDASINKDPVLADGGIMQNSSIDPKKGMNYYSLIPVRRISEEKGLISICVISSTVETTTEPSRESKRWQILKSIVYGGLAESITSLGIVTSAASANAKTANIVVLGLANLIGGLFVIGHNLKDLKTDQLRTSKAETEEQLDRYDETLGEREHMVFHFSIVILSFLVFGLIPPLVYGLSFRESGNRGFKITAVAGISLLCISLLALGKAHIQRPGKWQKYVTVIIYYLGIGIGVSGLSYLAGYLIGKLIEKLGWFKSSSEATLLLPQMSFSEAAFGSN